MSAGKQQPDVDHLFTLASRLPLRDQARLAEQLLAGITRGIEQITEAPRQLSLFETPEADPKHAETSQPPLATAPAKPATPVWEFAPAYDHTDLIAAEPVVVYMFSVEALSIEDSYYSRPVYRQLLQVLKALGQSEQKRLREQAFTIFAGDIVGAAVPGVDGEVFALAAGTQHEGLSEILRRSLAAVPGYCGVDTGSSKDFMPAFRYDHGYVIEYTEPGAEGSTYLDGPDNYGSGLTIYRRTWRPAEDAGRRRSSYGKLLKVVEDFIPRSTAHPHSTAS